MTLGRRLEADDLLTRVFAVLTDLTAPETRSAAVLNTHKNDFVQEDSMTPGMLPLDTEEWADDLLTRLFAVLTHLEALQTRSAVLKAHDPLSVRRRTL